MNVALQTRFFSSAYDYPEQITNYKRSGHTATQLRHHNVSCYQAVVFYGCLSLQMHIFLNVAH